MFGIMGPSMNTSSLTYITLGLSCKIIKDFPEAFFDLYKKKRVKK
jgi:hypothetical protein